MAEYDLPDQVPEGSEVISRRRRDARFAHQQAHQARLLTLTHSSIHQLIH
jgi:hypothetical protein